MLQRDAVQGDPRRALAGERSPRRRCAGASIAHAAGICYQAAMRYLHTMVRVRDLPAALRFFCDGLGLAEIRRRDYEQGRFTLVYLGTDPAADAPQLELTHNWDHDAAYTVGRNFGHVAYEVDDIYAACQRFVDLGADGGVPQVPDHGDAGRSHQR